MLQNFIEHLTMTSVTALLCLALLIVTIIRRVQAKDFIGAGVRMLVLVLALGVKIAWALAADWEYILIDRMASDITYTLPWCIVAGLYYLIFEKELHLGRT